MDDRVVLVAARDELEEEIGSPPVDWTDVGSERGEADNVVAEGCVDRRRFVATFPEQQIPPARQQLSPNKQPLRQNNH
jgi:hypothetical protein